MKENNLLTEIAKMIYFDFEEYEVGSVAEVTWRENKRRQKQYKEKVKPILTKAREAVEGAGLTPVETMSCYKKSYSDALEWSEEYETALSAKNWNPNRPADRERYFCTSHLEWIMRDLIKAQTQAILKAMGGKVAKDKTLAIKALCNDCPKLPECQSSNIEDCERREIES